MKKIKPEERVKEGGSYVFPWENKAKAGLICGIIGIIGSVILITVFVVNILLSSDFQNEMKEFNTHYDTYIDENDDSI